MHVIFEIKLNSYLKNNTRKFMIRFPFWFLSLMLSEKASSSYIQINTQIYKDVDIVIVYTTLCLNLRVTIIIAQIAKYLQKAGNKYNCG